MSEIVVIFEGAGRRCEKAFATIAGTADFMVDNGYTRVSGDRTSAPIVGTRLFHENGKGRYARINTTSTPRTWPVIVDDVADRIELLRVAEVLERQQKSAEDAMWHDLYQDEEN